MRFSKSLKVNLNFQAASELENTAEALGISESEVLRRGLAVMRHYSEAKQKDKDNHLVLIEGGKERKLIVS